MATLDLQGTSIVSSTWSGAGLTIGNINASDDTRATGGVSANDTFIIELDNAPGDFDSLNSVTLHIEGRMSATGGRTKQFQVELLDSANNQLQTFTTGDITTTDAVYSSTAFTRADAASVIDGYRIRVTLLEGGGMPAGVTSEIDHVYATIDYNLAAQNYTMTADQQSYTLSGQAASLLANYVVVGDQQSYTLAGQAANTLKDSKVVGDQQSYTLAGQAADLTVSRAIVAEQGSFALAGQAAGTIKDSKVVGDQQSYTLSGQPADLYLSYVMTAEQGSYTLSGQAAGTIKDSKVVGDQQSYALAGQAAALLANYVVVGDQQSYALAGQAADFLVDYVMPADQGSFSLAGQAANLVHAWVLTADQQSYALSGQPATLTYTPLGNPVMPAAQGDFTLAGQAATLNRSYVMVADQQSYTLSGQAAGLLVDRVMVADQQSYTLSGQAANLLYSYSMVADEGAYSLAGQDANLVRNFTLTADQQSYTLSGQAAGFLVDRVMVADQASYTFSGQAATLGKAYFLPADQADFTLAGQPTGFVIADTGIYTIRANAAMFQYQGGQSFVYKTGGSGAPASETLPPDGLLIQSNLAGTLAVIDDPVDVSDGQCLTAISDNTDSQCVVSFPTPSGLLISGVGLQEFRARVRLTANGSPIPWSMYLRESGVRLNGGSPVAAGTVTGEQIISALWNANQLSQSDGSGVECEIYLGRQAGNPSVRTAGEVCAVEWVAEYSQEAAPPVTAESALFNLAGLPANLSKDSRLVAEQGDFLTVGNPVNITRQYTMRIEEYDAGFFSYAFDEGTFTYNRFIAAEQGNFALSGQAINFLYKTNLVTEDGDFTLNGQAANLRATRKMTAEPGVFKFSPTNTGLYGGAVITMTADQTSFALAGQPADFLVSVIPAPLAFSLQGQDAIIMPQRRIEAEAGVFTWTGFNAAIGLTYPMVAEQGDFTVDGQDANLARNRVFTFDEGSFTLAGGNANLYWSGVVHAGPDDQDIQIVVVS